MALEDRPLGWEGWEAPSRGGNHEALVRNGCCDHEPRVRERNSSARQFRGLGKSCLKTKAPSPARKEIVAAYRKIGTSAQLHHRELPPALEWAERRRE